MQAQIQSQVFLLIFLSLPCPLPYFPLWTWWCPHPDITPQDVHCFHLQSEKILSFWAWTANLHSKSQLRVFETQIWYPWERPEVFIRSYMDQCDKNSCCTRHLLTANDHLSTKVPRNPSSDVQGSILRCVMITLSCKIVCSFIYRKKEHQASLFRQFFRCTEMSHIPSLTVSITSSFPLRPFPSATVSLNLYIPSTRLDRRRTAWWSLLFITSYSVSTKKSNQSRAMPKT